jgi:hypothetical protein
MRRGEAIPAASLPARITKISAIGQLERHLGVAALRDAPAHEMLAAQFAECRLQCRLLRDPGAVLGDDLIARARRGRSRTGLPHLLGRPT